MHREDLFVEVEPGMKLFCEIVGDGAEVVLVTNACWLSRDFDPFADGRRLVFVDSRGRGRSTPVGPQDPVSRDDMIADLEKVRSAIGIDTVDVLGWSVGGGAACGLAMRHPERVARVVTVGWLPPRSTPSSDDDRAEARWRFEARGAMAQSWKMDKSRGSGAHRSDPASLARAELLAKAATQVPRPEVFSQMRSTPWECFNEQDSRWMQVMDRWRSSAPPGLGGDLVCPLLVIYGDSDSFPLGAARDWTWSMRDARLLHMSRVGHYPWLEDPESFFSAVSRFLLGDWPPAAQPLRVPDHRSAT